VHPQKSQNRIRVGCQGWNYDDWTTGTSGVGDRIFYPRGTRASDMLEVYARAFETVEVDSTFYAVPSLSTIEGWRKRTPENFTFALKLPREITHQYALRGNTEQALTEFCERARALGDKLAVVLIQLPPQFEATAENARALCNFLPRLPQDIRFSVEFRSPDWLYKDTLEMLARHNVALALVEGTWIARQRIWQALETPTAPFAYVRWMGERDLALFNAVQRPQNANLRAWSDHLAKLPACVTQTFAYFSNFYEGHAPASANKLKYLSGQHITKASDLEDQPSLF
jgi:uncharacterized protein YecE (DUF72 family)